MLSLDVWVKNEGNTIPIEALESSTRVDRPCRLKTLVRCATSGLKSGLADKGTKRTLVGAIAGGKERTWGCQS
jgi:hypothetical protein